MLTFEVGARDISQDTYTKDLSWLLSLPNERRKCEAERKNKPDPPHGTSGGDGWRGV